MDYKAKYKEWLENPYFDQKTKEELRTISDDEHEIKERFYTELAFGTGGLRGIIGAGTNRFNMYTVGKATQGLANYILKQGCGAQGVAIAYDSRRMSPEFANATALVLAANGIKAYLFDALRPTPELSFAVRKLGCIAGVNITASHNPPEYNGYKVYWADGAQVTPPHDADIMDEVQRIVDYTTIKTITVEEAKAKGLYELIGAEIDDAYMAELKKLILHPEAIAKTGKEIKIVYSPLHGTGNLPVRRILKEVGFEHVYVVKEQELPDGEFPTVAYPNPEAEEAFKLGLKLAKEVDADIVLATDPDADRLGVRVKDKNGAYHELTGNMLGCLLAEYVIGQRKALNLLPEDGYLVKTIVTTNMTDAIGKHYGVNVIEVLTGFKYIGEQILRSEILGKGEYLFGFEESYGCLIGTHARDKDAVGASLALCEATAFYKTKGMTLWDAMLELYDRYGYYYDGIEEFTLKGIEGIAKIQEIMGILRDNPLMMLGEHKVLKIRDYERDTVVDLASGEVSSTGLPRSNVLYYELENDMWLCVRPSGTEPKMKVYFGVKENSMTKSITFSTFTRGEIKRLIEKML